MNAYLAQFLNEKFDKQRGKALDLGAGDFSDVVGLKQLGWQCEGIDIKIGIDLEKHYISENGPFDVVFSNYVIHKINNKEQLVKTIFDNLKVGGWFFIHTFDNSDKNSKSNLTDKYLQKLFIKQGFKNISTKCFKYYDNDKNHEHWHCILEIVGQK